MSEGKISGQLGCVYCYRAGDRNSVMTHITRLHIDSTIDSRGNAFKVKENTFPGSDFCTADEICGVAVRLGAYKLALRLPDLLVLCRNICMKLSSFLVVCFSLLWVSAESRRGGAEFILHNIRLLFCHLL